MTRDIPPTEIRKDDRFWSETMGAQITVTRVSRQGLWADIIVYRNGHIMSAPTTTVRITHSWCPTCQGGSNGKARCSTPKPVGTWPATVAEQVCIVCVELAQSFCERCGE